MSEELKPCPFCGGEAVIEYVDGSTRPYDVYCTNGRCLMEPLACWVKKEEAIAAWNARADDGAQICAFCKRATWRFAIEHALGFPCVDGAREKHDDLQRAVTAINGLRDDGARRERERIEAIIRALIPAHESDCYESCEICGARAVCNDILKAIDKAERGEHVKEGG